MNPNKPIYHLALVTLEALTAHGIRSGAADAVQDVVLLRDANGLPALPGTSLAGLLRHLYTAEYGQELANQLFGSVQQDEGHSSAITLSWALAHDSQNQVLEGLREDTQTDPILNELSQSHPIIRQRVRLNARGTATDTGKFDVSLIPAGTRYSTLVGFWSDGSEQEEQQWQDLLALFYSPFFRIGHGTRAGAGAFAVQALHSHRWDLRTSEGKAQYLARPRTRMQARSLPKLNLQPLDSSLQVGLSLTSEAGWRVGGGDVPLGFACGETPDLLPQSEWQIEWKNDQANIAQRVHILPATAIKGALVHRFAFHYRCLTHNWVTSTPQDAHEEQAVKELFGVAGDSDVEGMEGMAGLVFIDDLYLDNTQTLSQMHNRIDHFTGGVMNGALFEEGLLWQTPIQLKLQFQDNSRLTNLNSQVRQALQRTLEDLASGLLPLGAGGSRGQGVFIAEQGPQWSDGGKWVEQGEQA
ncbi:hypothetical protein CBP31_13120 [Oceanisphaera profunda]|uniref:CRISPR type III-associated protein domain-containing protein n=1 Tax=Oceanisphaera profunda TaxID=1416627 RepID=A0A1Y0D7C4_9GAMM|nr:RAMP superfamily CRISPR-associated protein [Oceanisphaera profunda]ART83448.1 hypothetical protein CBP31_13120 [Oceanisphaera profunda]